MKVYYSYDETGVEKVDNKMYKFLEALKIGFRKHMDLFKNEIEEENGFFVIKVDKELDGRLEYYQFSRELETKMIPYIDSFNNAGYIVKIYFETFPTGE